MIFEEESLACGPFSLETVCFIVFVKNGGERWGNGRCRHHHGVHGVHCIVDA